MFMCSVWGGDCTRASGGERRGTLYVIYMLACEYMLEKGIVREPRVGEDKVLYLIYCDMWTQVGERGCARASDGRKGGLFNISYFRRKGPYRSRWQGKTVKTEPMNVIVECVHSNCDKNYLVCDQLMYYCDYRAIWTWYHDTWITYIYILCAIRVRYVIGVSLIRNIIWYEIVTYSWDIYILGRFKKVG